MSNVTRIKNVGLSILFTLTANVSLAGGSGTGGGVSIKCSADPNNGFDKDGFYLLDYVQASKEQRRSWTVLPAKNGNSIDRIKAHLHKVISILQEIDGNLDVDFRLHQIKDFPETIRDQNLWYPLDVSLKQSELINGSVPQNCDGNGIQVVTFNEGRYWYWGQGLSNLEENSIDQYAALYTHEMLRKYGMNTKQVLKWTPVLHSSAFLNLTGGSLLEYLLDRGLINTEQFHKMKAKQRFSRMSINEMNSQIKEMEQTVSSLTIEVNQIADAYNNFVSTGQKQALARILLSNKVPRFLAASFQIYIESSVLRQDKRYRELHPILGIFDRGMNIYFTLENWPKTLKACASDENDCGYFINDVRK